MKSHTVGSEELCSGSIAGRGRGRELPGCTCCPQRAAHLPSSIAAFAASPPSSRNDAGKSTRDGRADVCTKQPVRREQKGPNLTGADGGLAEKELMSFTLRSFHRGFSWQPAYFIFIRSNPSISKQKSPKQSQMAMGWK